MEKVKPVSLLTAMLLLSVPSLTAFAQDSDEEESEAGSTDEEELTYEESSDEEDPSDEEVLTYVPADEPEAESTDEEVSTTDDGLTYVPADEVSTTDEQIADNDDGLTNVPTDEEPLCDPSYPDYCIPPPPPDLNCGDEEVPAAEFTVLPPDPHGFDDDYDGLGCESNIPEPTTPTTPSQPTTTPPPEPTNNNNHPPIASDSAVTTSPDRPMNIQLSASDQDNDALVASIVTAPVNGTLANINQENRMVIYTPNYLGFTGTDTFTFKVNDGKADSNTATVKITITKDNCEGDLVITAGTDMATTDVATAPQTDSPTTLIEETDSFSDIDSANSTDSFSATSPIPTNSSSLLKEMKTCGPSTTTSTGSTSTSGDGGGTGGGGSTNTGGNAMPPLPSLPPPPGSCPPGTKSYQRPGSQADYGYCVPEILEGKIFVHTHDGRGDLPLKGVKVELRQKDQIFDQKILDTQYTDKDGKYTLKLTTDLLPNGVQLRVTLEDQDKVFQIYYRQSKEPVFVEADFPNDWDIISRMKSTFTAYSVNIVFDVKNDYDIKNNHFIYTQHEESRHREKLPPSQAMHQQNVASQITNDKYPHLAALYYYATIGKDFMNTNGVNLSPATPLKVHAFNQKALTSGWNTFYSTVEGIVLSEQDSLLAYDDHISLSKTKDAREASLDTFFHEFGHFIRHKIALYPPYEHVDRINPTVKQVNPLLGASHMGHLGYAAEISAFALEEGMAYFISSLIQQTTPEFKEKHQYYNNRAHIVTLVEGTVSDYYDIEKRRLTGASPQPMTIDNPVGPRIESIAESPIFEYQPYFEEFNILSLLWDFYDDTPTEDRVSMSLLHVLNVVTSKPTVVTVKDLYLDLVVGLTNLKLNLDAINQLFANANICVEKEKKDGKCSPSEVYNGLTAWEAYYDRKHTVKFGYPLYPYPDHRP